MSYLRAAVEFLSNPTFLSREKINVGDGDTPSVVTSHRMVVYTRWRSISQQQSLILATQTTCTAQLRLLTASKLVKYLFGWDCTDIQHSAAVGRGLWKICWSLVSDLPHDGAISPWCH